MNKIKFTLVGKTISKSKDAHAIWLHALRDTAQCNCDDCRKALAAAA